MAAFDRFSGCEAMMSARGFQSCVSIFGREPSLNDARCGLRGVRVGEASNPGPQSRVRQRREDVVEDLLSSLEFELTMLDCSDDEFLVRYGFIMIRVKVDNFIKNHFHQKPLSSKTTFIKNHFHQKPHSSKTTFIKNNFHQNHFHQNHFHQNPISSKTTFIKNDFHQKPLSSKNTFINNHFHQ